MDRARAVAEPERAARGSAAVATRPRRLQLSWSRPAGSRNSVHPWTGHIHRHQLPRPSRASSGDVARVPLGAAQHHRCGWAIRAERPAAGRWTIAASKGGFVTQQFGQRHPFESVEPVDLAEGQRVTANFTLSRGSVITGRVSDEFGDPITGARVQVLRSQVQQGRRRLAPIAVAPKPTTQVRSECSVWRRESITSRRRSRPRRQTHPTTPSNVTTFWAPRTSRMRSAFRCR